LSGTLIALFGALLGFSSALAASDSCSDGIKNFPFLRPWAEKLSNFAAPYESSSMEGSGKESYFYAFGATLAGPGVLNAWMTDAFEQPIEWQKKQGSIQSRGVGLWGQEVLGGRSGDSTPNYLEGWNKLREALDSSVERGLIERCADRGSCKVKLDEAEMKAIASQSSSARSRKLHDLIEARVRAFIEKGELKAYEGTSSAYRPNTVPVNNGFFSKLQPKPARAGLEFGPDRSFFGFDVLELEPGTKKQGLGIFSRGCEKNGEGSQAYTRCVDLVVYNNHYFDFWGRTVFFFPWCGKTLVLAYETMDVDQVHGSRVIRVLFGGQIRELVGRLLEARLKRLHMLGF
jgi:hypothetical protein